MKQGTGHSSAGQRKVEPRSTAINPATVSELGVHQVRTRTEPMDAGRGFTAPAPVATTTHKSGSQGKR